MTPVTNTLTRSQEAEADIFGLNASRQPDGMADVALKLGEYRKLEPGPIEEFVFFDHPSGRSRILMAMRWKAEHPEGPSPTAPAAPDRCPQAYAARLRVSARARRRPPRSTRRRGARDVPHLEHLPPLDVDAGWAARPSTHFGLGPRVIAVEPAPRFARDERAGAPVLRRALRDGRFDGRVGPPVFAHSWRPPPS